METLIAEIDSKHPEKSLEIISQAAAIIKDGGLVAFPTETVYGLGANGLSRESVEKIYKAKGRPSDNPLILHISRTEQLDGLVNYIPDCAKKIMDAFWPGPITLIFPKSKVIPDELTGGLDTVAIRMPGNNAARLLIDLSGVPIAAPSANISGKPSPTRASHVFFDLNGKIDMILDGGPSEYGLESTILDVTSEIPNILRPGSVTKEELLAYVPDIILDKPYKSYDESFLPKAPGMKYTHYSPKASVTIVRGNLDSIIAEINKLVEIDFEADIRTGIMATKQTSHMYTRGEILVVGDRDAQETIASNLFKALRKFDYKGIEKVYVEAFDLNGVGCAIMNRLYKAAGYNVIDV